LATKYKYSALIGFEGAILQTRKRRGTWAPEQPNIGLSRREAQVVETSSFVKPNGNTVNIMDISKFNTAARRENAHFALPNLFPRCY
jgi:hypothetical protein